MTRFAPIPGSRWTILTGPHAGSQVEVVRTTSLAVFVREARVGWGRNPASEGCHRISIQSWHARFAPARARDKRLCAVD